MPQFLSTTLARSANEFAVDLFQCYIRRHGDKYINLLLCPYLIYHSLAMMLVGAQGNTNQQLMKLLRIKQQDVKIRHREFLMLTEQLIHGNHDFVHLASFIYLDKTIKRTEMFKNILRDYYETKPKKIEFDNVDATVKTINEDVARTTENIYNDILSRQEAQKLEKSMLLVNAVFFRGFWLSNFTELSRGTFQRSGPRDMRPQTPGSSVSQGAIQQQQQARQAAPQAEKQLSMNIVNMMSKLDYLPILHDEQLDARIIKMPFEASDLQMLVILPNERQSNAAYLCDKISAGKIEQIAQEFSKAKSHTTRVTMPVFCVDSGKISIQSTLVMMGASDLFDKSRADMSGICENKQIWLNKILHRCFIICDNRGSITSSNYEKARKRHAATFMQHRDVSLNTLIGVDEFTADHPFMYIIMDSVTRTILLIGMYTDPKETLEVIHENQLSPEEAHQIYTEGVYKT